MPLMGTIFGLTAGELVVVCAIAGTAIFLLRRHRRKGEEDGGGRETHAGGWTSVKAKWASLDKPMKAVLVGVALLVALFLVYRGIKYYQCRSDCDHWKRSSLTPFGRSLIGDVGNDMAAQASRESFGRCVDECKFF